MGYAKVKGRFSDFSGMFRYDESNLANTSVTLIIKTESIDSDLEFRDNDLKSENWFDAKKFPTITFKSKSISKAKTGFDVVGDLTIKDVTKEVTLHLDPPSGVLKDVRGDAQVIFTGTTSLNRNDFGVEGKRWSAVKEGITAVDSEVKIEVSILGKQLKAANFSNWVSDAQKPAGKLYKLIKEQGVDVVLPTWRGLVAPADIKGKDLETLSAAVDKMVKSDAWQKVLKERGWLDLYMPRAEFKPFLDDQRTEVSAILKDLGLAE